MSHTDTPTDEAVSESIRHVRRVHFSLVLVWFAILVAFVLARRPYVEAALEQLGEVEELVARWDPLWFHKYLKARFGGYQQLFEIYELSDDVARTFAEQWGAEVIDLVTQPYARALLLWPEGSDLSALGVDWVRGGSYYRLVNTSTDTIPGQRPHLAIDNTTFVLVPERDDVPGFLLVPGRDVAAGFSRPKTLSSLRDTWDSLTSVETRVPVGEPDSILFIDVLSLAPVGQFYVMRPVSLDKLDEGVPFTPVLSFVGLPLAWDLVTVLDDVVYGPVTFPEPRGMTVRTRMDTVAINGQEALLDQHGVSWDLPRSPIPFVRLFPQLSSVTKAYSELPWAQIRDILDAEVRRSGRQVSVFGASFPVEFAGRIGVPIILAVQLYLLAHLKALSRTLDNVETVPGVPWIGLYPDTGARAMTKATTSVAPAFVMTVVVLGELIRVRGPVLLVLLLAMLLPVSWLVSVEVSKGFRRLWLRPSIAQHHGSALSSSKVAAP